MANADVTDGSAVDVDANTPTLTTVTIASSNTIETLALVGDVITLSVTASEDIDLSLIHI